MCSVSKKSAMIREREKLIWELNMLMHRKSSCFLFPVYSIILHLYTHALSRLSRRGFFFLLRDLSSWIEKFRRLFVSFFFSLVIPLTVPLVFMSLVFHGCHFIFQVQLEDFIPRQNISRRVLSTHEKPSVRICFMSLSKNSFMLVLNSGGLYNQWSPCF